MNEDYFYNNPFDYNMQMQQPSSCGCGKKAVQYGMQPSMSDMQPPYMGMQQPMNDMQPPMNEMLMDGTTNMPGFQNPMYGYPASPNMMYQNPINTSNEERVIPLLVGGLIGASIARPWGYAYAPYYYYPPYYYTYYNYGYYNRRYPYYYYNRRY